MQVLASVCHAVQWDWLTSQEETATWWQSMVWSFLVILKMYEIADEINESLNNL